MTYLGSIAGIVAAGVLVCTATDAACADRAVGPILPTVAGTRYTFRGARRDGSADTWITTMTEVDRQRGLFQLTPHHDVVNVFTKRGFSVDEHGVYVQAETLDEPGAPHKVLALPLAVGATGKLPGVFFCVYTVGPRETVKVAAGTFSAWRISLDDVNPEATVWLAPGVGIVKIRQPGGRVDELVAVHAP